MYIASSMSTRVCLVALIGLPAAGKSTFSRWILSLPQQHFNVIHLCYDDHLPAQDNSSNAEFKFKIQRNKILATINSLICEINTNAHVAQNIIKSAKLSENANCHDFLILCDDNNYYRSMRYKLYQLCRQNKSAYAQIYLECDVNLALNRNGIRPNNERVSDIILQRMAIRLEKPDSVKQYWEENTFVLGAYENLNIKKAQILNFLCKSFDKTPHPLSQSVTSETVSSLLHQLDLLLRKRIGQLLNLENNSSERSRKAQMLIAKRKEILQEVRKKAEQNLISTDDFNTYECLLN